MYKILLLALPSHFSCSSSLYDLTLYEFKSRNRLWSTPQLGLLTIGSMLSKISCNIDYVDLNYEEIPSYNVDFVFMSPTTSQALTAYNYANKLRRRGIKVIMGGSHVSMLPNEALVHADAIFIGEAEDSMESFMHDLTTNNIQSMYVSTVKPDIKKSPVPMYELARKYPYKSVPVQLSRGCPHQCNFCLSSTIYGKMIRRKDMAQVRDELTVIKKIWKKPFIFFTDDNFLISQHDSHQVLDILEELKLEWYAFTDISIYRKQDLLNRLAPSGCRKLLIGFESLNDKNLIELNSSGFKASKRLEYKKAIHTIQQHKIGVIGSFVLGLQEDNERTFDDLYAFIIDTCIYGTNITIATPFPGTGFYNHLKKKQTLSSTWSDYDGFSLLYDLPHMTKKVFLQKYVELIHKINSKERLNRVLNYFKKL